MTKSTILSFTAWGLYGLLLGIVFGFYIDTWEFWVLLLVTVILTTIVEEAGR